MIDVLNYLSFQVHGSAGGHKSGDSIAGFVGEILTFLKVWLDYHLLKYFPPLCLAFLVW